MKTVAKILAWAVAMVAVSLAIVYAMYLILVFWLFSHELYLGFAIAGLILLFVAYWHLLRMAEC